MTISIKRTLALASIACSFLASPMAAQAVTMMQATVTGTISGGFDAYRNSVYFGNDGGNNLTGMQASVTIVYDADLAGPNYPGYAPNWDFWHSPSYPNFLGQVGNGPVKAGYFTVNGVTLASDVSGQYEVNRLRVENPDYAPGWGQSDNYSLYAMDSRFEWCPNDGQCAEKIQISAYQQYLPDDMFGGQHAFSPADTFSVQTASNRFVSASVRLYQNTACLIGGNKADNCPEGRFDDGQTHWVEFTLNGTQMTVSPAAVPEPQAWTLALTALGLMAWLGRRQRFNAR